MKMRILISNVIKLILIPLVASIHGSSQYDAGEDFIVTTLKPIPSSILKPTTSQELSCPFSMFKCVIDEKVKPKSNNLVSILDDPQNDLGTIPGFVNYHPNYICLNQKLVCDGKIDCPKGQDESEELCKQHQKPSSDKQTEGGCYLCQNTKDLCLSMDKICNNLKDCPESDDEKLCNGQWPMSYSSQFKAQQYGATNINIVNRDSGNIWKKSGSGNEVERKSKDQVDSPIGNNGRENPDSKSSVQDGVGFQFRVNNFVVYNSEIKMFNQDSDDMGHGSTPSQFHQQNGTATSYSNRHSSSYPSSNLQKQI